MSSKKSMQLDRKNYPGVERKIKESIQYLIDNYGYYNGFSADEVFEWWISKEPSKTFFYNLRNQTKLELCKQ